MLDNKIDSDPLKREFFEIILVSDYTRRFVKKIVRKKVSSL